MTLKGLTAKERNTLINKQHELEGALDWLLRQADGRTTEGSFTGEGGGPIPTVTVDGHHLRILINHVEGDINLIAEWLREDAKGKAFREGWLKSCFKTGI